jgi:hypothetical protein
LKILSDDKLKEIGKPGRQSLFWMRKVAEAQAKLTARDIFAESDKLILEPLPSNRLSNNVGLVIRESYNELKKRFGVE